MDKTLYIILNKIVLVYLKKYNKLVNIKKSRLNYLIKRYRIAEWILKTNIHCLITEFYKVFKEITYSS